jgi:hypothetical protein
VEGSTDYSKGKTHGTLQRLPLIGLGKASQRAELVRQALFLLPFCFFAYRRSAWGIVATLLVFPTSLFWFPAPENPSPRVEWYLAWERQFVTEGSIAARLVLVVLVVGFFVALAAAFWKHNWLWDLVVLNAATLLKVIWSITFGGEAGWASLAPSVVTLVVTDAAILLAARWLKRRRERRQGAPVS